MAPGGGPNSRDCDRKRRSRSGCRPRAALDREVSGGPRARGPLSRRRAILVLYEIEGATIPAIARLVGVSPVTVRWHLSIGRHEMAKALGRGTS